jgi:hypothetical protein
MNEQKNPNTPDKKPDGKHAPALSEAQFLTNQVNEASAAIGAAFNSLKADLSKGLDPKVLTDKYPWLTIGAAAVAGFVATSALVPSKEQQALKKLERIERALSPHHTDYTPPPSAAAAAAAPQPQSLTGKLFSQLFSALKPALSSALATYAAQASGTDDHHDGNGHSKPDPSATGPAASNAAYFSDQESNPDA